MIIATRSQARPILLLSLWMLIQLDHRELSSRWFYSWDAKRSPCHHQGVSWQADPYRHHSTNSQKMRTNPLVQIQNEIFISGSWSLCRYRQIHIDYKAQDQHRFIHSIHETSSPGYSFNSTRLPLDTLIDEQTSNIWLVATTTKSEQGAPAIL